MDQHSTFDVVDTLIESLRNKEKISATASLRYVSCRIVKLVWLLYKQIKNEEENFYSTFCSRAMVNYILAR